MDQPLGMAVGNSLEVIEAIETLRGDGPDALTELSLVFGERMLVLGKVAEDPDAGARAARGRPLLRPGARRRSREWVEAQGGDPRVAEDTSLLPLSPAVS